MENIITIIFILISCIACKINGIIYTDIIELPQGQVRGLQNLGRDYRRFLGIPYATVVERFQGPGDPPSWSGILNATNGQTRCNQHLSMLDTPSGQEDCLVLNIYTPGQMDTTNSIPVMVFIHGGGFYRGSATPITYDPRPLVEKGVIVVTINYRVGAFGFLCLKIEGAPGNAGLKDQVAALKWVNRNINYFGGDPQRVTIFGNSAGAASVHYLILSPTTNGLFDKAIMQSGDALTAFAFSNDPVERASKVAAKLGYDTKEPYELLKIFQDATPSEIVMASLPEKNSINAFEEVIFRPCAENPDIISEPFITKPPKEILQSNDYLQVPTIIGYNDKEGIFYAGLYNEELLNKINDNFDELLPDNLSFNNVDEKKKIANEIKSFYFGENSVNQNSLDNLVDYFSDMLFHYSSVISSEIILKNNRVDLYNYYFTYDSLRNVAKFIVGMGDHNGAAHADELFYIFQPIYLSFLPQSPDDQALIHTVTTIWTNFAKIGYPIDPNIDNTWLPSEHDNLNFFVLDKNMHITSLPNPERIEMWRAIYRKYGNYGPQQFEKAFIKYGLICVVIKIILENIY